MPKRGNLKKNMELKKIYLFIIVILFSNKLNSEIINPNEKLLPYHNELKDAGACFGVTGGFERPMWYSLNGEDPKYDYSYKYQNICRL